MNMMKAHTKLMSNLKFNAQLSEPLNWGSPKSAGGSWHKCFFKFSNYIAIFAEIVCFYASVADTPAEIIKVLLRSSVIWEHLLQTIHSMRKLMFYWH